MYGHTVSAEAFNQPFHQKLEHKSHKTGLVITRAILGTPENQVLILFINFPCLVNFTFFGMG